MTIGDGSYFVGLEIKKDREKKLIMIHQKNYLLRVVNRFNMNDAKRVSTPGEHGLQLDKSMRANRRKIDTNEEDTLSRSGWVPYARSLCVTT